MIEGGPLARQLRHSQDTTDPQQRACVGFQAASGSWFQLPASADRGRQHLGPGRTQGRPGLGSRLLTAAPAPPWHSSRWKISLPLLCL